MELSEETKSECPICESQSTKIVQTYFLPPDCEIKYDLGNQVYNRKYLECKICAHWFAKHEMNLSNLYENEYVRATYGGLSGLKNKYDFIRNLSPKNSDNIGRVNFVIDVFAKYRSVKIKKRLLDVGAGLGVFGAEMLQRGWEFFGLELDDLQVQHLKENVCDNIFKLDIRELDSKKIGLFDLISFNKVLEHLENPIEVLSAAHKLLAPNGLIYFEVPDVIASRESPRREEFTIEHFHVFSPSSVAILAQKAKFDLIHVNRIIEPSSKYTIRAVLGKSF